MTPQRRTLAAIRAALEVAGVTFTNGDEPGVKLRLQGERGGGWHWERPLTRRENETFIDKEVVLDNYEYCGCTFRKCILLFSALPGDYALNGCRFYECTWRFEGAAGQTIRFLDSLSSMPGGRKLVLQMFPKLREKDRPVRKQD